MPVGDDSSLLGRNACIIATFCDKFRRDGKFYQSRFGQSHTDCVASLRYNVAVLSAAGLSPWHLSGFSPLVIRKPQQYKSHPMRPAFPPTNPRPERPLSTACSVSHTHNYIQIKDTRRLSTLLGAGRCYHPLRCHHALPTTFHHAPFYPVCYSGIPRPSYRIFSQLRSSSLELTHTSAQCYVDSRQKLWGIQYQHHFGREAVLRHGRYGQVCSISALPHQRSEYFPIHIGTKP